MAKQFYYPTEERIYQLKELSVPPLRYASFLFEAVRTMEGLILEKHNCSSLEEVSQKDLQKMKQLNPGKPVEELREHPLTLSIAGKLCYDLGSKRRKQPEKVYRSTQQVEYIYAPPGQANWLELASAKQQLAQFVAGIGSVLDQRFQRRGGKVPEGWFAHPRPGRDAPLAHFLDEFEFALSLQSFPTSMLEVEVSLRDYGCISYLKKTHSIPAIHLTARQLANDSRSFPRKVAETLGELVTRYYKVSNVKHQQSYEQKAGK